MISDPDGNEARGADGSERRAGATGAVGGNVPVPDPEPAVADPPLHAPGGRHSTDPDAGPRVSRGHLAFRILMLLVTALALYLVLPGLLRLFGSLPQLEAVFPAWFVPIFVLEAAAFVSIWELMRIALDTDNWFDIACAQLSGNALSRALPGGAATGGATMYQMLTRAGFDGPTASTALTAVGLLSTATLFVLPILALPAMLFGLAVRSRAGAGRDLRRRGRDLPPHRRVDPADLRPRRARVRPRAGLVRAAGAAPAGPRADPRRATGQVARLRAQRAGRVVEAGGARGARATSCSTSWPST